MVVWGAFPAPRFESEEQLANAGACCRAVRAQSLYEAESFPANRAAVSTDEARSAIRVFSPSAQDVYCERFKMYLEYIKGWQITF